MVNLKKYKYDVRDCDVLDTPRLEQYREKRKFWIELLSDDEEHAIISQINQMIWNDAVFRVVNHARKLSAKKTKKGARINNTVSDFIDQSYVSTQLLAIRRLAESSKRGDEVSLKRLVKDMKECTELFTRENYVSYDGLPFDPDAARQRFLKNLPPSKLGPATGSLPTDGPEAWGASDRAHLSFDRICLGEPSRSNRKQRLDPLIFDRLVKNLGACSRFEAIASKFVAHAADQSSRQKLPRKQRSVTLAQVTRCHQAICRVAAFVYGPILYIGGFGLLPHAQFGHLKYLDEPWVDTQDLRKLEAFWHEHQETVESWVSGDWIEKTGVG